ncbi:hypothetical protein BU23DRAFT_448016 [Bimuria novae-zelandiae CBS 107.79]|uniref:EthD domain-containing protein n=1 Tax=Bimuria novae-zelandiae CBS 107.79 TaxID=1447943 RepID=A0A6A5VQJ9_9PLEO|nr:hypothetical protein BU23DRAFT_448016 [Bimuria novae-zelandiae CBS 107.79]
MAENTSSTGTKKQQLIKLGIFVKRDPSLTSEELHERWSKMHGPLVKGWPAEKGIYRYYRTPPEMTSQGLGIHDTAGNRDFDGAAEVTVENLDILPKLVEDNFFSEFTKPDEASLVDPSSVRRTIGYEEVYVDQGKVVDVLTWVRTIME